MGKMVWGGRIQNPREDGRGMPGGSFTPLQLRLRRGVDGGEVEWGGLTPQKYAFFVVRSPVFQSAEKGQAMSVRGTVHSTSTNV